MPRSTRIGRRGELNEWLRGGQRELGGGCGCVVLSTHEHMPCNTSGSLFRGGRSMGNFCSLWRAGCMDDGSVLFHDTLRLTFV
jgi:hypothetical protein